MNKTMVRTLAKVIGDSKAVSVRASYPDVLSSNLLTAGKKIEQIFLWEPGVLKFVRLLAQKEERSTKTSYKQQLTFYKFPFV